MYKKLINVALFSTMLSLSADAFSRVELEETKQNAHTEESDSEAEWDVLNPPFNLNEVTINTDETTWSSLDVSPNGEKFVFDMLGDLYISPIAGGEATSLTQDFAWNIQPTFSPDGKKIAFVTYSSGGPIIRLIDLVTGKGRLVADFKGVNSAPAWSPDGTKIAYSSSQHGSPDIFVYDMLTKKHKRISTHYSIETEPSWSPRGESFLFTSNRSGKPQIYSYSAIDESASRVTFEEDESANASYNAICNKIVMVQKGGKIVVMDEDSGRITPLTIAEFDESPSFSPNGDMVLYKSEEQFEAALMVSSSDGRVKTRLKLVSGDVREPAWSPLNQ